MNILIISGSPRRKGTTNRLMQAFIKGAAEKGHNIKIFDAARAKVSPCKGCYSCTRRNEPTCIIKDDMAPLLGEDGLIMQSDVLVLVSPVYYFSFCAQLKTVIDRMYCLIGSMHKTGKKTVLITASGANYEGLTDGILGSYREMCKYLKWDNQGIIGAFGCNEPGDLDNTGFEAQAYELGKSL